MQPPPLPSSNKDLPFKLFQLNGKHSGREYHIPAVNDGEGMKRLILGRTVPGVSVDVDLEEPTISRKHAALLFDGETLRIEHLSGSNPTMINDEALLQGEIRYLKINDTITLANIKLRIII